MDHNLPLLHANDISEELDEVAVTSNVWQNSVD